MYVHSYVSMYVYVHNIGNIHRQELLSIACIHNDMHEHKSHRSDDLMRSVNVSDKMQLPIIHISSCCYYVTS